MIGYKIDLTRYEGIRLHVMNEKVQKKAFELGYKWQDDGKKICEEAVFAEWIYVFDDCGMKYCCYNDTKLKLEVITAEDFMKLSSTKEV